MPPISRIATFLTGAISSSIALTMLFFSRLSFGTPFPPEKAADRLFAIVPGALEAFAVTTMGEFAKYSAFAGFILLSMACYGLLGLLCEGLVTKFDSLKPHKLVVRAALPWAFFLFVFLPLSGYWLVGFGDPLTVLATLGVFAAANTVHASVFTGLLGMLETQRSQGRTLFPTSLGITRRKVIKYGILGALGITVLGFFVRQLLIQSQEQSFEDLPGVVSAPRDLFERPEVKALVAAEVTPNGKFYVVSKNLVDPRVDGSSWSLKVDGLVARKLELSYNDLLGFEKMSEYATLICISNVVGGDLISNALWTGVPFDTVLRLAGLQDNVRFALFHCADGYSTALPIERLKAKEAMLAYLMNGETLPQNHGFPLRAIVPGVYGMKNPKWITRIEFTDQPFDGYWESRGWSNTAKINTFSRIDKPAPRASLNGKSTVAGIAFAGADGVSKVEISFDGGRTWHAALVKEPLSNISWAAWAAEWVPPKKGAYRIRVRAIDGNGQVQTANTGGPFPSGSTGQHEIQVTVEN